MKSSGRIPVKTHLSALSFFVFHETQMRLKVVLVSWQLFPYCLGTSILFLRRRSQNLLEGPVVQNMAVPVVEMEVYKIRKVFAKIWLSKSIFYVKYHWNLSDWRIKMKEHCIFWNDAQVLTSRYYSKVQFSRFNNFFRVCWFFAKNLSYFISLPWKLHNRYCHSAEHALKYCQSHWTCFQIIFMLMNVQNTLNSLNT